jgi:3-deoxy-D-manno-octulosonic-acid transferase
MIKRSELIVSESIPVEIDVVIGDSFGEMASYYASSDIVVMGGTLLGTGGQNLIEPCALGRPVILGPSTFNFKQVSEDAIACGAAISICSQNERLSQNEMTQRLNSVLDQLLAQPEKIKAMGEKGIQFTYHHQGATRKTINFLKTN